MCNIDPSTYENDSVLEQAIIYQEKTITAGSHTIGAAASAASTGAESGGANIGTDSSENR
jgi:hypothetical protein